MATFPKLTSGVVTQYPSGRTATYSTSIMQFVDGKEQRFRELKSPVRRWLIELSKLSAHEEGSVEAFFSSVQGQFGSFTFVDPWDDVEYPDCSFDQETLNALSRSESANQTYLVIRNNRS